MAKRLSKDARREQLLESAMAIVAEQGADALTLATVAERAGVTKPVAYEHFGTRAGLLLALYRRIDARQADAFRSALARTPRRIGEVARVMGDAYMSCYSTIGPEWHAITAALKGDPAMEAVQQELLDGYVDLYHQALRPFSKLPPDELQLRCVGIVGAGEAISRDLTRGRVDADRAAQSLAAVIQRAIKD
ncbi:TetR/AcrR family transcriptional regulator [Luteimonas sp. RD2P54]|uniref:TetR/AcrR family transcriptional regulator n=1 Tax=Luteimonas endophytica TaxID=3042023 RepID=A0ABT6J555_9GAMM|nr:TetR/AcrR family transcriptional regulator [Luteimonas endophytica]MDH5821954.1 TetR/AcrR family transcriptional regulator [Luteimonas endophytica]